MSSPRVEIGGIWVVVLCVCRSVEVKDEFVWGEEDVAEVTLNAFRSRTVVTGRYELPETSPAARMPDVEGKVLRKFGW